MSSTGHVFPSLSRVSIDPFRKPASSYSHCYFLVSKTLFLVSFLFLLFSLSPLLVLFFVPFRSGFFLSLSFCVKRLQFKNVTDLSFYFPRFSLFFSFNVCFAPLRLEVIHGGTCEIFRAERCSTTATTTRGYSKFHGGISNEAVAARVNPATVETIRATDSRSIKSHAAACPPQSIKMSRSCENQLCPPSWIIFVVCPSSALSVDRGCVDRR